MFKNKIKYPHSQQITDVYNYFENILDKIKNQNDSENSNRLKIEKGNKEMRKTRKPLKIIQSCKNIQINTYEKRNIIDILLSKISET